MHGGEGKESDLKQEGGGTVGPAEIQRRQGRRREEMRGLTVGLAGNAGQWC